MRILLLKLLCLSPLYILAQIDSSVYLLKQLNKKQPDSVQAYFNIKLSDLHADKNPSQALAYSRKGFQLATSIGSDRLIYSAANNLAESLRSLGSYDSSLYYAKQCNDAAQKLDDPLLIFNSLNLLGNIYLSKPELTKAKKSFDEAMDIAQNYPSLPHLSRIYQNISNYYFKTLKTEKAIEMLRQGKTIASRTGDQKNLMGIYSNLGVLYVFTRKIDSAQKYLLPALDYFHKAGKIKNEAQINQHLGMIYGQLKNTSKMEQHLDNSYNQFMSIGDNVSASTSLMQKMNSHFQSFQYDKCLKALNAVEPAALKNKQANILSLSYTYKSVIFSLLQDTVNSEKYLQMADNISDQVTNPVITNMNNMMKRLITGSRLTSNEGDSTVKKALLEAKKWIPASIIESSLESVVLNKDIVNANKKEMASLYKILLSDDSSKSKQLYDSLIRSSVDSNLIALYNKQTTELETQYKTKQKDDSIHVQTQLIAFKTRSVNTRNYLLAGLAALAFLILILFLRSRSQAKKINRQYSEIQKLQSELTHRTRNFFNSIKGMLAVASATTTDSKTVSSLTSRVATINHLYTTLYSSPGKSQLPFSELLASICNDFEHSFGSEKKIKVYHQTNASISKEESVPLAFIITELLTNAEKYAFEGKESGEIHVEVAEEKDKRVLHVWDNGKGRDESIKPRQGSQGMGIIKSYNKNLEGTITTWNDNGFHFKMEF